MERKKLENFFELILKMNFLDLVRLCLRMTESDFIKLHINKKKYFKLFDKLLRILDKNYKNSIINFNKYYNVTIAIAILSELNEVQQNLIFLFVTKYVYNVIKNNF